jgi:hypothetical protein
MKLNGTLCIASAECGFLNGWMMVENDGVIYNFSAFCDAHYRLLNPETSSRFKDGSVV